MGKEAATNGNSKLKYGIQWLHVLQDISAASKKLSARLKEEDFVQADPSGTGIMDVTGLAALMTKVCLEVKSETIDDLVFLTGATGNASINVSELVEIYMDATSESQEFVPTPRKAA